MPEIVNKNHFGIIIPPLPSQKKILATSKTYLPRSIFFSCWEFAFKFKKKATGLKSLQPNTSLLQLNCCEIIRVTQKPQLSISLSKTLY